MGKVRLEFIGWGLGLLALAAFFLPWLKTSAHPAPKAETASAAITELSDFAERPWYLQMLALRSEEVSDACRDPLTGVSGFGLLSELRKPETKREKTSAETIFLIGSDSILEQGMLIYAVPSAALVAACFLSVLGQNRLMLLIPLVGSGLIYWVVRTKVNETYFERIVSGVQIGVGLWLSLYAILALILLLLYRLIAGNRG